MNALVQEISRTVGGDLPYVDPDCGGVNARVLLVLEAPAGAAAHGSRMLSADNNDGTAVNVWRAYQHAGLPREWGMHWNAVPWYLGVRGKIAAAKAHAVEQGREWVLRLVDLLPELSVVLCLGNAGHDAVSPEKGGREARGLTLLSARTRANASTTSPRALPETKFMLPSSRPSVGLRPSGSGDAYRLVQSEHPLLSKSLSPTLIVTTERPLLLLFWMMLSMPSPPVIRAQ